MAKVEKKIIDKNKLYLGSYKPKDLYFDGEVNRAVWNGEIKFNRAMYYIELSDTALQIHPSGINLYEMLGPNISRKRDLADDVVSDVSYIIDAPVIEPNEDETKGRSGFFIVTQDESISGLTLQGFWEQAKDYLSFIGVIDKSMSPRYSQALAGGGYISLSPYVSGQYVEQWASGKPGKQNSWTPSSTVLNRVKGVVHVDGATLDPNTGKVYAPDRGTNKNNTEDPARRVVATITYINATADGETIEWNGSLDAVQEDNTPRTSTQYDMSSRAYPDPTTNKELSVEGAEVEIRGTALERTKYAYPSGSNAYSDWENSVLYVSSNVGSFRDGKNTLRGSNDSVVLYVGSTSENRSININVNNAYAEYNVNYEYKQTAVEFVGYNRHIGFYYAEVSYPQASAGYSVVSPQVTVFVKMCAVYSDGSYDESDWIKEKADSYTITAASYEDAEQYKTASLNKNNGKVTVQSLGTTWVEMPSPVFEVNSMTGSYKKGTVTNIWTWTGEAIVVQEENIKNYTGREDSILDATIEPGEITGSDTKIQVSYEAFHRKYYYWNSAPSNLLCDETTQWLYIRITGSATASQDVKGSGTWTYDVGAVGSSDRTFYVRVTDNNGRVVASRDIKQSAKVFDHYAFESVQSVGVSYEEAPAWASTVYPFIQVVAKFRKMYNNGTADPTPVYETYRTTDTSQTIFISSASGQPKNTSGATIAKSTGAVSVKSLGETPTAGRPVFEVQSLYGTFYSALSNTTHDWQMPGTADVDQHENYYHDDGDPFYNFSSSISSESIEATDTTITISGTARKGQKYYWDSYGDRRETAYTNQTLYVMNNRDVEGVKHIVGSGSVTFEVGINTSTTTQRTFLIEVYDADRRYFESYYVVQGVNSAQEWWAAPTLNGTIQVEDIPANGSSVTVLVPIKQVKYSGVEGSSSTSVVETFTGSVLAVAINGDALSGAGVSFSDGYISASNLGTTPMGRRTVYTLKQVTVYGKDNRNHTLTLPSWVEIKQEANIEERMVDSTYLSLSKTSISFTYAAQSTSFVVYAYDNVYKKYTSGSKTSTVRESTTGTFSVSGPDGLSLPSAFSAGEGGSTYQVSATENVRDAAKNFTVTAKASSGLASKSLSVTQASAVFVLKPSADQECNGTATTVYVSFESSRNGKVLEPAFSANVSGVTFGTPTLSGTTYTVAVNIPANPSTSNRDIVVYATQTRWSGNVSASLTITQAGAADVRETALVYGYGNYANASKSSVNVTLGFDARDTSKYKGGTVKGVYAWLTNKEDGTGITVGSGQNVGDVTVSQGRETSRTLTFNGTSGYSALFLMVRYDTTKTFVVQIEDYEP